MPCGKQQDLYQILFGVYPLNPRCRWAQTKCMSKSPSSSPALSVREFFTRFPDGNACLEHIMAVRFGGLTMDCPSCGVEGAFHKLPGLPSPDRADR